MAPGNDEIIYVNGRAFRDVTNKTCAGPTYSYAEAVALTEGRRIATGKIEVKRKRKPRP